MPSRLNVYCIKYGIAGLLVAFVSAALSSGVPGNALILPAKRDVVIELVLARRLCRGQHLACHELRARPAHEVRFRERIGHAAHALGADRRRSQEASREREVARDLLSLVYGMQAEHLCQSAGIIPRAI